MKTNFKHIHFEKIEDEWWCFDTKSGFDLGAVKISNFSPVFRPTYGISFTGERLAKVMPEIITFMTQLNAEGKR